MYRKKSSVVIRLLVVMFSLQPSRRGKTQEERANPLAPQITVSYGPNSSLLPALSGLFAVSIHEKV